LPFSRVLPAASPAALAQAARVVDGDTLELIDAKRIQLSGIDAVEGDQICQRGGRPWRFGDEARAALLASVDDREFTCIERDVDRYGRIVAACIVNGQEIGADLVRQGWALDYERYSGASTRRSSSTPFRRSAGCGRGAFVPPGKAGTIWRLDSTRCAARSFQDEDKVPRRRWSISADQAGCGSKRVSAVSGSRWGG
jgi:endonuclease YncB( thermonuclease family)